jgi:hypothetical protein
MAYLLIEIVVLLRVCLGKVRFVRENEKQLNREKQPFDGGWNSKQEMIV